VLEDRSGSGPVRPMTTGGAVELVGGWGVAKRWEGAGVDRRHGVSVGSSRDLSRGEGAGSSGSGGCWGAR